MKEQLSIFGRVIKSISFDEGDILKDIMSLYCPNGFDIDPCYSRGNFYKRFEGIPEPKFKYDINPQFQYVKKSNANSLPHDNLSINSIIYDPPFLAGENSDGDNHGIICSRFSQFKSMKLLWKWYEECIKEFYRILDYDGVFSHCHIMNIAVNNGFYPKDLFLLLAKQRIIGGNHKNQQHARKYHCYYWIFLKQKCKVDYNICN